jgi:hypothetical protein
MRVPFSVLDMVPGKRSMTFLEAALRVLEEMKVPMHFKKITEQAVQKGYLRSRGKTPEWTMGARISVDIKNKGAASEFIRVDSGRYGLRRWKRVKTTGSRDAVGEAGPRYWLVSMEPQNFRHDLESNRLDTVGVRQRMMRTLQTLSPGDLVVLYIKRLAQFGAILEVTGHARLDDSPRWPAGGDYRLSARIACRPISNLMATPLDARPLYTKLGVFNQYPAKHRTLALRNGITEISKADFESINSALRAVL